MKNMNRQILWEDPWLVPEVIVNVGIIWILWTLPDFYFTKINTVKQTNEFVKIVKTKNPNYCQA